MYHPYTKRESASGDTTARSEKIWLQKGIIRDCVNGLQALFAKMKGSLWDMLTPSWLSDLLEDSPKHSRKDTCRNILGERPHGIVNQIGLYGAQGVPGQLAGDSNFLHQGEQTKLQDLDLMSQEKRQGQDRMIYQEFSSSNSLFMLPRQPLQHVIQMPETTSSADHSNRRNSFRSSGICLPGVPQSFKARQHPFSGKRKSLDSRRDVWPQKKQKTDRHETFSNVHRDMPRYQYGFEWTSGSLLSGVSSSRSKPVLKPFHDVQHEKLCVRAKLSYCKKKEAMTGTRARRFLDVINEGPKPLYMIIPDLSRNGAVPKLKHFMPVTQSKVKKTSAMGNQSSLTTGASMNQSLLNSRLSVHQSGQVPVINGLLPTTVTGKEEPALKLVGLQPESGIGAVLNRQTARQDVLNLSTHTRAPATIPVARSVLSTKPDGQRGAAFVDISSSDSINISVGTREHLSTGNSHLQTSSFLTPSIGHPIREQDVSDDAFSATTFVKRISTSEPLSKIGLTPTAAAIPNSKPSHSSFTTSNGFSVDSGISSDNSFPFAKQSYTAVGRATEGLSDSSSSFPSIKDVRSSSQTSKFNSTDNLRGTSLFRTQSGSTFIQTDHSSTAAHSFKLDFKAGDTSCTGFASGSHAEPHSLYKSCDRRTQTDLIRHEALGADGGFVRDKALVADGGFVRNKVLGADDLFKDKGLGADGDLITDNGNAAADLVRDKWLGADGDRIVTKTLETSPRTVQAAYSPLSDKYIDHSSRLIAVGESALSDNNYKEKVSDTPNDLEKKVKRRNDKNVFEASVIGSCPEVHKPQPDNEMTNNVAKINILDTTSLPEPLYKPQPDKIPDNITISKVFCDIETTSLSLDTEIVQIAAVCDNDSFDQYILPLRPFQEEASKVTGLTCDGGILFHRGVPVMTLNLPAALQHFLGWLDGRKPCVLIGHNFRKFDYPRIYSAFAKCNLIRSFHQIVFGCVDTLPLFKEIYPDEKTYKQETLVTKYVRETYDAHNSVADVKSLKRLVEVSGKITQQVLCVHSFSGAWYMKQSAYKDKCNKNANTFKALIQSKVISKTTVDKIAASGLQLKHLQAVCIRDGADSLMQLLVGRASVTKATVEKIIPFLKTI